MAREGGLIAWQWRTYADNHRDRVNLLLHIVAVPAFIAGILATVRLLVAGLYVGAGIAFVFAVFAFAVQGIGHKREAVAPIPFDGPLDFVGRVFVEQFVTFPRFVLSGQWARNFARG
ncbi:MAG TPA: Mpo1-like protein [Tahibacter sp.]|uniref:Mpo1-like protein n=1 Tax=Tahibacter sp. TaxID=2056211 RepID=UPI002B8F3F7A|nr:Mpo1-like protein [Tahibacter sp.]HSX63044.1 Mpo1-like protein [Tahibacter sp.]